MGLRQQQYLTCAPPLAAKLRDRSGASIVIALAFFLICAIIGSVVLTAASVQSQQVATHKELQQANYSISSAAQLVGAQLGGTITFKEYDTNTAGKTGAGTSAGTTKPEPLKEELHQEIFQKFIVNRWGNIWDSVAQSKPYTMGTTDKPVVISVSGGEATKALKPVSAIIAVGTDFSLTVELWLTPEKAAADSPYRETVTLQCAPSYDAQGRLTKLEWGNYVVAKSGDAA